MTQMAPNIRTMNRRNGITPTYFLMIFFTDNLMWFLGGGKGLSVHMYMTVVDLWNRGDNVKCHEGGGVGNEG